ncbi:hypothetical protein NOVOSPHI9U_310049 [Novosphingobium sp. 9U]|nr:hypothetical protein NOVOSPHI9U_310049 [Novosphingobium sp. 9U]
MEHQQLACEPLLHRCSYPRARRKAKLCRLRLNIVAHQRSNGWDCSNGALKVFGIHGESSRFYLHVTVELRKQMCHRCDANHALAANYTNFYRLSQIARLQPGYHPGLDEVDFG